MSSKKHLMQYQQLLKREKTVENQLKCAENGLQLCITFHFKTKAFYEYTIMSIKKELILIRNTILWFENEYGCNIDQLRQSESIDC